MPSDNDRPEPNRDGKIGECDGCDVEDTYLALTSEGWLCAACLTPERLAEVLDISFWNE